jgi:DNA ligase-1
MRQITPPIYKRGTDGKLRTWQVEVDGDKYRTIAGLHGGNLVTSAWTTAKPKNPGRANATTAEQQAMIEALADEAKKLKREYRRTIAELDDVVPGPMLAATYEGNLAFPVWSQPKLDGIRALISARGAFTREGQPHNNVQHILDELAPLFAAYPDLMFDGELYNHDLKDDFNDIVRLVRKQKLSPAEARRVKDVLQFHIYDIPSNPGVFGSRAVDMLASHEITNMKSVKFVATSRIASQKQLDDIYDFYTSQGYEGQMVRLDTPYEFDTRSKGLLKRKEFETKEFELLKIEEGEGNWAGYAKRVTFKLEDGRDCGGGIKGNQEFTKRLLNERFSQVTVRYFKRTPDGMPRFPVAIDFHNGRTD